MEHFTFETLIFSISKETKIKRNFINVLNLLNFFTYLFIYAHSKLH